MSDEKAEKTFLNNMRESPLSTIIRAFRHGQFITSMRLILYLIISCRFFGVCTKVLRKLRFLGEREVFQLREKLKGKGSVLGAVGNVIRLGAWPALLSFVVVAVLYYVPSRTGLGDKLRYLVELAVPSVHEIGRIDDTTYLTLLTTVAGASGVFLALYFTTLSIVAASYSEPHHREIRNLIIENRVSRGYLSILSHVGAVCLFGLVFLGVGFGSSLLVMIYVVFIGGIVILSFFFVGRHIFQFLDPRSLAHVPEGNFLKAIRSATIHGTRWKLPAFQNYFRKQAMGELYKLECIVECARSQTARREIESELCIRLLHLLSISVSYSSKIPSLSMWFPRKRRFKEWGFTSDIEADIALRTGNVPRPEEVPDYLFMCKAISRMVRRGLEGGSARHDYMEVAGILQEAYRVVGKLGDSLAMEEGRHLLSEVRTVLFGSNTGLPVVEKNDRILAMSMASIYGTCVLNLAISSSGKLESMSADDIVTASTDLKDHRMKRIYKRGHPREVLRHLEEFHQRLLFERRTEGGRRSADWFLREHVARRYADYVWNVSEKFVLCVKEYCVEPVQGLMKAGAVWTTAELLRSAIETTKKIGFRVAALGDVHEKLRRNAVTREDWQSANYGSLRKSLEDIEAELLRKSAEIAPMLTSRMDGGEVPDYAGIFRAYLSDALVSKMQTQNMTEFKSLFTSFFRTTLGIAERHMTERDNHFSKPHMKIALDTTLDLLDLSGLALLFSELHGSDFYKVVKDVWDEYFEKHTNEKGAIEFFYHAISANLQLPAMSPSGTERWNWERAFVGAMAKAGFNVERMPSHWEDEETARSQHQSRIIQSIYPHMGMMFTHPYDYFAAFYFSLRTESRGVELPDSSKRCKENVDRETERRKGETGS